MALNIDRIAASRSSNIGSFERNSDSIINEERIIADVGILYLRTVIFLNAGAIVAILGFSGQILDKPRGIVLIHNVFINASYLIGGMVLGVLAIPCAFGRVAFRLKMSRTVRSSLVQKMQFRFFFLCQGFLSVVMDVCAVLSLAFFAYGIWHLRSILVAFK